jgi:hypothetical protein
MQMRVEQMMNTRKAGFPAGFQASTMSRVRIERLALGRRRGVGQGEAEYPEHQRADRRRPLKMLRLSDQPMKPTTRPATIQPMVPQTRTLGN